jgi:hypothetical protein
VCPETANPGLVPQGYVLATDAQVLALYKDAGFSPSSGVDGFVTGSDVSDGGALFNSFAALFGKTDATGNFTSGLSASPEFQVANGVASGLTNNAVYGPSSATFDHSDSVATQTPDDVAVNTTSVTDEAYFMYKVSLPTLAGATITLNNSTVTVAIGGGQTVGLDALVTAFYGSIPSLIIQGPGTADIAGAANIPDLEVTSGASLVLQGGTVTTDPVTVDAGGNITGDGTITGAETVNGNVTATGGTLDITGNVSGSGTLTADAGASLQLEGTIAATNGVAFASGGDSLILGASADVFAPVSGFGLGDSIALEGLQVTSAVYSASTKALAITGSGGTVFDLSLAGAYQQSNFALASGDVVFSAATPPVISGATPAPVEKGQTTVIGTATPGVAGDPLTLTETAGAGTLSLGPVQTNGTQQVIYTAPACIPASTRDAVSYTIKESDGATATSPPTSVQLDSGPFIALLPFAPGAANKAITIATVTPGLPTDTLSLVVTKAPQSGTVSLQGNSVQYTPASSNPSTPVTFSFDVKDELGGMTPVITVVAGDNGSNTVTGAVSGYTDVSLGNGDETVSLGGNGNAVSLGNGNESVTDGGGSNKIAVGNGNSTISLGGGGNTVTAGNGNDTITFAGSGSTVKFGNGTDTVHGGTGDTINIAGNATLTLYGTNEMVFIGTGNSTINDFSSGLDLKIGPTAGNDILSHFAASGGDTSGVVDLVGGIGGFTTTAAVLSALKSDGHGGSLLSFGSGSSLDFAGVASSQLHASNFQIG